MRFVVTGPPAAGKSTLLAALMSTYVQHAGHALTHVTIDGVLRGMYSDGELLGRAEMSADGSLIIADFNSIARQTVERLAAQVADAFLPVFVEIPLFDWRLTPKLDAIFTNAHVLVLTADVAVRIDRNRERGGHRISEDGMLRMAGAFRPEDFERLRSVAASVVELDTGTAVETSIERVHAWLRRVGGIP